MTRKQQFITSIIIPALVLSLSACHSSRQAVNKTSQPNKSAVISPAVTRTTARLKGDSKKLVDEALTWVGTPYRYGGQDYSGTDCSGLTMKVYHKALGIKIPRNSAEQQKFCDKIKKKQLTPGDLLFFCTGKDNNRVSHVGLYIGDGQFIHSSASRGVIISHIDEKYYTSHYHSSGFVKRKGRNAEIEQKTSEIQPIAIPQSVNLEMEKELDQAIENRIDSIYTSFLD